MKKGCSIVSSLKSILKMQFNFFLTTICGGGHQSLHYTNQCRKISHFLYTTLFSTRVKKIYMKKVAFQKNLLDQHSEMIHNMLDELLCNFLISRMAGSKKPLILWTRELALVVLSISLQKLFVWHCSSHIPRLQTTIRLVSSIQLTGRIVVCRQNRFFM